VLNRIDEELTARPPSVVLGEVLSTASTALRADGCAAVEIVDGRWIVRHAEGVKLDSGSLPLRMSAIPYDHTPADPHEVVAIENAAKDKRVVHRAAAALGIGSALAVPLFRGDASYGMLLFSGTEPRSWTVEQIDFASQLGTHLSLAVQNEELLAMERERSRLSAALNEIDQVIHSALNFGEVMDRALDEGVKAVGADTGSVALQRSSGWVIEYQKGLGEEMLGWTFGDDDMPYVSAMAENREYVAVPDVEDFKPRAAKVTEFAAQQRIGSYLVVPLVTRSELTGLMFFNWDEPGMHFSENHADFCQKLGASVSLAIDNAILLETERGRSRFNRALADIDNLIHSSMEIADVMHTVAEASGLAMGCDSLTVEMLEDGEWVLRDGYNIDEERLGNHSSDDEIPYAQTVVRSCKPLAIEDAFTDERADNDVQRLFGIRSVLVTPIYRQDEVLGLIFFNYHAEQHTFSAAEMDFAERLSSSLSLALENARLYEHEHRIAETLQETLLVMPHHIHGIRYARHYQSATESARVGGDFVDVFQLTRRRVVFALGDVSGKGLEAASLTAMVRDTLRAHLVDKQPPSVAANKTNNLLKMFTGTEAFVTVCFGVLDIQTGKVTYVSAGHPPPIVIEPGGTTRAITGHGAVLGAFSQARYDDMSFRLELGECLLLYSDGVTEARRDRVLFGEERLREACSALAAMSPREVADGVFDAVNEYADGVLRDDIALLAITRRPPAAAGTKATAASD
jgi:serine phosphatase RsbU (regulator of sigma subunit)